MPSPTCFYRLLPLHEAGEALSPGTDHRPHLSTRRIRTLELGSNRMTRIHDSTLPSLVCRITTDVDSAWIQGVCQIYWLNGELIYDNERRRLTPGDVIQLADEALTYRYRIALVRSDDENRSYIYTSDSSRTTARVEQSPQTVRVKKESEQADSQPVSVASAAVEVPIPVASSSAEVTVSSASTAVPVASSSADTAIDEGQADVAEPAVAYAYSEEHTSSQRARRVYNDRSLQISPWSITPRLSAFPNQQDLQYSRHRSAPSRQSVRLLKRAPTSTNDTVMPVEAQSNANDDVPRPARLPQHESVVPEEAQRSTNNQSARPVRHSWLPQHESVVPEGAQRSTNNSSSRSARLRQHEPFDRQRPKISHSMYALRIPSQHRNRSDRDLLAGRQFEHNVRVMEHHARALERATKPYEADPSETTSVSTEASFPSIAVLSDVAIAATSVSQSTSSANTDSQSSRANINFDDWSEMPPPVASSRYEVVSIDGSTPNNIHTDLLEDSKPAAVAMGECKPASIASKDSKPAAVAATSIKSCLGSKESPPVRDFHCPICFELVVKATILNVCGHIYCHNCLEEHRCKRCPECRQRITNALPNRALDRALEYLVVNNPQLFSSDDVREYKRRAGIKTMSDSAAKSNDLSVVRLDPEIEACNRDNDEGDVCEMIGSNRLHDPFYSVDSGESHGHAYGRPKRRSREYASAMPDNEQVDLVEFLASRNSRSSPIVAIDLTDICEERPPKQSRISDFFQSSRVVELTRDGGGDSADHAISID
jgi:hypothetical protein